MAKHKVRQTIVPLYFATDEGEKTKKILTARRWVNDCKTVFMRYYLDGNDAEIFSSSEILKITISFDSYVTINTMDETFNYTRTSKKGIKIIFDKMRFIDINKDVIDTSKAISLVASKQEVRAIYFEEGNCRVTTAPIVKLEVKNQLRREIRFVTSTNYAYYFVK